MLATTFSLGPQLCKALGLDPSKVLQLRINFKPADLVTVDVEMVAEDGSLVPTIFEQYELYKKEAA